RFGVGDDGINEVREAFYEGIAQFSEDFMVEECLRIGELLRRAHLNRLALSVKVQVALAANNFDERINNRRKSIRIDPGRFKRRKSSTLKFDLRLNQIVGIYSARCKHALYAIRTSFDGLAVEVPAHEVYV